MKVQRYDDRNHVRVEELLPCNRFSCRHELVSCAIYVWCPDGCHDDNNYGSACIPKCIDCVHYPEHCDAWEKFPEREEHRALILGVEQ